jgi:2-C-methyl-D-erythritol 4-phosphate cytidylyltransferase
LNSKYYAIIVAGGTGSRMNTDIPKQFIEIDGKPLIIFSIEAFYNYKKDIEIIIPVHADYRQLLESILKKYGYSEITLVIGGATRYHSVKNALEKVTTEGWVAIHDAARPVIDKDFIAVLFDYALQNGNAVPAVQINETVRLMNGGRTEVIDRSNLRLIQTPQIFDVSSLKDAYVIHHTASFTDDAMVMEASGHHISLCEGNPANIKVTNSADLIIVSEILKRFF